MTTAAIHKIKIEAKWPAAKIQQEAAGVLARNCFATMSTLSKFGPEAVEQFQKAMNEFKIEYYKTHGVKTPLDLVKAMSEFEANVFGSKVEIWGDDTQASLTYNSCAIWDAMQKLDKASAKQAEEMGHKMQSCMQHLAQGFGFKAEVKFEEPTATVTFSK